MHTGISSDGEDGAVGAAAGPSKILEFRGARPPHDFGSAAGDDSPSSPAISLGSAVNAVVMRLSNKRIRVRVERHGQREEDDRGAR